MENEERTTKFQAFFDNFKKKNNNKVKEYLTDKEKTEMLLDKAKKKADNNKGPIGDTFEKFQLLIMLVKDYVSGKYKSISAASIMLILFAILYFVSPLDTIPDVILGFGFIDDASILAFVISQVAHEIKKYEKWKNKGTMIND